MKAESQIYQKLKQAQYRHMKRLLQKHFEGLAGDWPEEEVAKLKTEYRDFFACASISEIARDFPDVAALMWVLDDQPDEALVPNGSLVGKLGGVHIWADTEEQAELARKIIDRVFQEAMRPAPEVNKVIVESLPEVREEPLTALVEFDCPEEEVHSSWWRKYIPAVFGLGRKQDVNANS